MKKTTGVIILALYLMSVVRPILPFVDYWLNYDYIANVLCINKDEPENSCNGKCHLNKKLAESTPAAEDNPEALPLVDVKVFPAVCPEKPGNQWNFRNAETKTSMTTNAFWKPQFNPQPPSPPPKFTRAL